MFDVLHASWPVWTGLIMLLGIAVTVAIATVQERKNATKEERENERRRVQPLRDWFDSILDHGENTTWAVRDKGPLTAAALSTLEIDRFIQDAEKLSRRREVPENVRRLLSGIATTARQLVNNALPEKNRRRFLRLRASFEQVRLHICRQSMAQGRSAEELSKQIADAREAAQREWGI